MQSRQEHIVSLRAEGLSYRKIRDATGAPLSLISYYCSPGQKENNAQRTRDRRNKIIKYVQELKANTPCTDCGENYPYFVMEFDHISDNKTGNISKMTSHYTLEQVQAEIAKCELVCSNCHKFRTWNRITKHGSNTLDYME